VKIRPRATRVAVRTSPRLCADAASYACAVGTYGDLGLVDREGAYSHEVHRPLVVVASTRSHGEFTRWNGDHRRVDGGERTL
jgi:hypothetical protein